MDSEKVVEKTQSPEQHQKNQKHQKKDRKKHEQKKEKVRHERPAEFERNADLITVDTVLPPLPKKNEILPRPNLKDYQERQAKNKQKITKLIQKKKQLYAQKFKASKPLVKGEGGKHDDFNTQIEQFKDLKDRFNDCKNQRNAKRDLLNHLIDEAKENNALLKKLRGSQKQSRETYEKQLERLEQRLITAELSKKQQSSLNSAITELRRKVKDAQPVGNIEVRIEKAEQRKQELDAEIQKVKQEKQPLEKQCKQLKQQMDSKNENINKIKGQIKNEKQQKTEAKQKHNKQYQQWKQNKRKRLDEASDKIKAIDEQNKNIWKEYHDKNDLYWEQKHKLDFLEWQHKVKERKVRDIEREKKKAIYEQKEKQREKQEQLQKYIKQIQLCNYLVNYLKEIQKDSTTQQKQQQKVEAPKDIGNKLGQDAEWKKQKGLVVLQSKKSKEDEEPVKKGGKKNKKKGQKGEQTAAKKFQIPFNVQVLFDNIKVLPPDSLEQVQKKIAELKQRQSLFERACGEEVSEEDKQVIEKIKGGEKKDKKQAVEKKAQDEFPTL